MRYHSYIVVIGTVCIILRWSFLELDRWDRPIEGEATEKLEGTEPSVLLPDSGSVENASDQPTDAAVDFSSVSIPPQVEESTNEKLESESGTPVSGRPGENDAPLIDTSAHPSDPPETPPPSLSHSPVVAPEPESSDVLIDTNSSESWTPLPPCANGMRIPHTRVVGDTLTKLATFYSTRWGNVLSPYWAARAMAELGGYRYQGTVFGRGTWMQFLPMHAEARPPQPEAFEAACRCSNWEFFNDCPSGWDEISETIAMDTRAAMVEFAKTQTIEETKLVFDFWEPSDWLLYERCCVLCHESMGFSNIRAMDTLPKDGSNVTVYTLAPPGIDESEGFGMCGRLHAYRDAYIRENFPGITLVTMESSSMWVDFSRIVYAPNLLIPSGGTSWGRWSFMANTGNVHVAQPVVLYDDPPHFTGGLHVLETPLMSFRTMEESLNVTFPSRPPSAKFRNWRDGFLASKEGRAALEAWYLDGWTPPPGTVPDGP